MTQLISNMMGWTRSSCFRGERFHYSPVYFSHVYDGKERIELKRRIVASVTRKEGLFFLENRELGMLVYEDSISKAKSSFEEYLTSLRENYLLEDDDELSESGKEFRDILREYFS